MQGSGGRGRGGADAEDEEESGVVFPQTSPPCTRLPCNGGQFALAAIEPASTVNATIRYLINVSANLAVITPRPQRNIITRHGITDNACSWGHSM